jgi:hypothetical protein
MALLSTHPLTLTHHPANDYNRQMGSIFLVFEFMEHDLGGLLNRGIEFTAPEVMCISKQVRVVLALFVFFRLSTHLNACIITWASLGFDGCSPPAPTTRFSTEPTTSTLKKCCIVT